MKRGFLFLCFLFCYINLTAQVVVGCFVPTENKVYTNKGSKGHYDNIYTPLPTDACWTPSITVIPCDACIGGLNAGGNCPGGNYAVGFEGSFTMVPCPLDDYIPLLIFAIAGFGLFRLRKRQSYINLIS
ncbi:MAG: hypothetical protein EON51_16785 [Acinetobacter sp.]|nr:MAG: hypothetical protein EON51_16785 [Acinetobacter sp.]